MEPDGLVRLHLEDHIGTLTLRHEASILKVGVRPQIIVATRAGLVPFTASVWVSIRLPSMMWLPCSSV